MKQPAFARWAGLTAGILAVVSAAVVPAVRAGAGNITVYNYDGNVSLIRGGRAVWLTFDMPCQKGDLIKVGADAFFDIECYAISGCRFGADSECVITNTLRSNTILDLRKGTALVNMKELDRGSTFQIRTPVATATVKGTQFWLRCGVDPKTGKQKTTFSVRKGSILVTVVKSSVTITLSEGLSVEVDEDTYAPNVRQMNDEEFKILDRVQTVLITAA